MLQNMQVISSTNFRKNIPKYLKNAQVRNEPIIINTRRGAGVFISLNQWNSLTRNYQPTTLPNLMQAQASSLESVWQDPSNDAYNDL